MLNELEIEFAQIRLRWGIHSELFGEQSSVKILNQFGPVFGLYQKLLVYDVLAALCRIADPEESCGKKNNSIYFHFQHRDSQLSKGQKDEIEKHLSLLATKMTNIRTMRNKAISHNDLAVALKDKELPKILFSDVDESIELVRELLNKIFCTSGSYVPIQSGLGPSTLISMLSSVGSG